MKYVYSAFAGGRVRIGTFGEATDALAALVPDEVGTELAGQTHLRVQDAPDAPDDPSAWHSARAGVYHTHDACAVGNNIEPENRRPGTGGKSLCRECARHTADERKDKEK